MFKLRIRVLVGLMIFLGYFMIYVIRYNISVHIVEIIKVPETHYGDDYNASIVKRMHESSVKNIGDLIYWDDMKMARLLSAYHIGFCICFPIFHSVGDSLGPTWVVGIAGFVSGILCCLTPISTFYNFWAVFVVRTIKGFCAGAMQPSMVQVLRHWVPPVERNHFMWAYCGITTGTCSTFLICAAVHYYAQWPIGFYVAGVMQVTWSALWVLIVCDYPRNHSCITKEELGYLTDTIGDIFTIKVTNSRAPWKLISKSVPFWTLCILNFGYSWMIISLCLHGPLYYSKVVKYSIYRASALTALPFFLRLILGTIVMQAYHWYKTNTRLKRVKHIRKYFVVVSHIIPGLIVCTCWLLPVVPGPILLTTAVALTAAGMDITLDLCYELTPTFANSVHTVIKIIGNTSGIIVSLCVGHVTNTYKNSVFVWKHIWCFHATVLVLCGFIFLIWGDIHMQPWNSRRILPKRKDVLRLKNSVMSNIIEVDEEVSANCFPTFHKKKSIGGTLNGSITNISGQIK